MANFMMIMGIGGNAIVREGEIVSFDLLNQLMQGAVRHPDGEYYTAYDNNLRIHSSTYTPGLTVSCPNCGGDAEFPMEEDGYHLMQPCFHCGNSGVVDSGDELVLVAQAYAELAERAANASVIPFDAPVFDLVLEPAILPSDDMPF
jgi:hypothetical protein